MVDGAEGGTGAAPLEFTNHVGAPLREGLLLVHNTLVGLNLRDRSASARPARSSRPSTSRAPWRSVPTGAMPRAASCSRSAASSRRVAIPASVQPVSPPKTRCASARWWFPTRPSACTCSTRTR
ncbi:MAG: glutamate synthase-related protein [Chiayiivirga sp.]|nr:glutamate synthase-related protein [Chiayiivirga sp.]